MNLVFLVADHLNTFVFPFDRKATRFVDVVGVVGAVHDGRV